MPELTLRSLYPEDLDQVAGIESILTGSSRREYLEKRLAVATALPDSFITCAAVDGTKLAGYGFARIQEGEFGGSSAVAVLDTIGVDPSCHGTGVGKMVLAGIERRMKNRNVRTLQTQISWPNNPMIRFFASTGFLLASCQVIERSTAPLADSPTRRVQPTVRTLRGSDIAAIDRIDAALTGLDRSAYFAGKFREILDDSGARVSLVAENGSTLTGFIMARIDYGEFGKTVTSAVIDTIGVHPDHTGTGIGRSLLTHLLANLADLQIRTVRTRVEFGDAPLRDFLSRHGFTPAQKLVFVKNN